MGFPTKHDHFEVFLGGYHLFKETPISRISGLSGDCRSPRLSTPSSRMHTMPPGGEEKTLEGFPVMELILLRIHILPKTKSSHLKIGFFLPKEMNQPLNNQFFFIAHFAFKEFFFLQCCHIQLCYVFSTRYIL